MREIPRSTRSRATDVSSQDDSKARMRMLTGSKDDGRTDCRIFQGRRRRMERPRAPDLFTETYLACLPMLIGLVVRYGGERREIQDIMQDIWIKGAKGWPPREIAFARAWLGRI